MTDLEEIPQPSPTRLKVIVVSQGADNKISDLEIAIGRCVKAHYNEQDTTEAWEHVCRCRKALFEHIANLEQLSPRGFGRVQKRF